MDQFSRVQHLVSPIDALEIIETHTASLGWDIEHRLRAQFDFFSAIGRADLTDQWALPAAMSETFAVLPRGEVLLSLYPQHLVVGFRPAYDAPVTFTSRSLSKFTRAAAPAPAWCNDTSVPLPGDAVQLFAQFHAATRQVAPRVLEVVSDCVAVPLFGPAAVRFVVPPGRRVRFLTSDLGHCTVAPAPPL